MRFLAILLCAGAALVTVRGERNPADTEITDTLRAFYKWYVPSLDKPGEDNGAGMTRYVTDKLQKRIAKLRQSKDDEIPPLDYDPFVNAQDSSPNWATQVAIRDVRVKGSTATATAVLGSGTMKSTVRLVLIRQHDRWQIDNFVPKL
jgi:hypothetical protein